ADGLEALIGAARAVFPAACMIVGALFLARSEILDMRPFRTGIAVFTAGLMLTLGKAHGGYVGTALALGFGIALGSTGVLIVGRTDRCPRPAAVGGPRGGRGHPPRGPCGPSNRRGGQASTDGAAGVDA